jgi:prophage regulatory protein
VKLPDIPVAFGGFCVARTNNDLTDIRILRRDQVVDRVGLSRAQIYALMEQGKFPKQIPLGANSVGWIEAEVNEWLRQRIAERDRPSRRGRKVRHAEAAE